MRGLKKRDTQGFLFIPEKKMWRTRQKKRCSVKCLAAKERAAKLQGVVGRVLRSGRLWDALSPFLPSGNGEIAALFL
jgi:hypothetical protein